MKFNTYSISELIDEIAMGPFGSNIKVECFVNEGIPVLNGSNLNGFFLTEDSFRYVTEEKADSLGRANAHRGDIVITHRGTLGQIVCIPETSKHDRYVISQSQFKVKCNEKVLPEYLVYYFHTAIGQHKLLSNASQVGVPALARASTTFQKIEVEIPDIKTQQKVVSVLNAIEAKINVNHSINENLLDQMQALYKSWFVDFLPFDGVMPESWTKTDIYSLANIIYGAPFASKQFNTAGEGKPIIRIRDLKDQQFATYTTEVHPKRYLLQPGDIVVGMDGEFRPYIWGNDEAWLNQRVCVFENKRPNGKAFLYFTIKPLLYSIEQTQVATTVIHIGKKDYDAFEITLPDTTTLDNFDALTSPMIMQIVSNSFENKRLSSMRDALLPKLMSGEIDVSSIQL
mgnify:CR=1 FL=1